MEFIISIDQGTTGTTCSVVSTLGQVLGSSEQDFTQLYPKPGWVEHDLESIWNTVQVTVTQAIKKSGVLPKNAVAIGLTNQRETVGLWNRQTGKPYANAIVWQDRRTSDFCTQLKKKKYEKLIRAKTGLVLDPYFSAGKIRWLLDHVSGLRREAKSGHLLSGTMDSFLLWKLTGGLVHATDVSNASRTQLMNIDRGEWDPTLLDIFGVPLGVLPQIRPSSGVFGVTKNSGILPDGIPISGIAGDQQSALFGQTCFSAGEAKCTFGTGSFLLLNTGRSRVSSKSGCLTTVAWQLGASQPLIYALEGSVFVCGAAVQWLRDGLGVVQSSSEVEALARQVEDSGGVEFVPALTGLGAPYWDPDARGTITGLTRGSTRSHLARATLEGMALQNVDVLMAMEKDLGKKIKNLKVDGGASSNNLLMQLQSDYLGASIVRPKNVETTSLGAAFLAGLGVGVFSRVEDIRRVWEVDREFKPQMSKKLRENRRAKWERAVRKALG